MKNNFQWKRQAVGKSWEHLVELALNQMSPKPYYVRQYPEVIFPGGQPVVTDKAVPDYFMVWDGVPFLFDTKSTKNKNYIKVKQKHDNQFFEMVRADRSGIICFYLVEWRENNYVEAFPVRDGDNRKYYNDRFKMVCGEGLGVDLPVAGLDWLPEILVQLIEDDLSRGQND